MKHSILSCAATERNRWGDEAEDLNHAEHAGHEEARFRHFTGMLPGDASAAAGALRRGASRLPDAAAKRTRARGFFLIPFVLFMPFVFQAPALLPTHSTRGTRAAML
jgi:hypothetical protein